MLRRRALRFLMTGGLTTAVAYVSLMLLLKVTTYAPAVTLSWVLAVGLGFALNRRFTFGIVGPERRALDFGRFFIGALLQLLIGLVGYNITLNRLHLDPTLAFLIVASVTAVFGFLFASLVAFRRASIAEDGRAARA